MNTTEEHGEFGKKKGSVREMEGACICGWNHRGDSLHGGCLLLHWPPEKVSTPPKWHLDCDRSDPETVSSPVLSMGSRGGPVTSTGTGTGQHGDGRGGGENSRVEER